MEPTIPALHCSITRRGTLTMNIGAAITGRERLLKTAGSFEMMCSFLIMMENYLTSFTLIGMVVALCHDDLDGMDSFEQPSTQQEIGQLPEPSIAVGRAQKRTTIETRLAENTLHLAEGIEAFPTVIMPHPARTHAAEGQIVLDHMHQDIIDSQNILSAGAQ